MGFRLPVLAAVTAAVLFAAPASAGAGEWVFLSTVEDLPLAPGLVERPNAGVLFDTPQGRIVEAVAEGQLTVQQVAAFYAEALPELGWVRRGQLEYGREDEVLRLDLRPAGTEVSVRFMLQPGR